MPRPKLQFSQKDIKNMCYLYVEKQKSQSYIAKAYHCSIRVIRNLLEKENIKFRKNYFEDLTNQKFSKFTVIKLLGKRKSGRSHLWLCRCECGRETQNDSGTLKRGRAKSCGKCRWVGDMNCDFWNELKRGAIRRKYEFNISKEYIWDLFIKQNKKCALTKLPLVFGSRRIGEGYKRMRTASLDRIDNDKGYIKGNVHWVHKYINKMRREFTIKDYIKFCKLVAENN